jgi:ribosome biogenesis GTPase
MPFLQGTVIAIQANYYLVRLDRWPQSPLLCTRRSRLKKIGQTIMVGDRVGVEEADLTALQGAIAEVHPRKTEFPRPPVANAEQILLVFSLAEPPLEIWQLSRFLVKAESTELSLSLCFNKQDLVTQKEVNQWRSRLEGWGYAPLFISVSQNQGLEKLQVSLGQKMTLMAGPSGAGKSSLINYLIPGESQRVKTVSGKLQKGRHTTRHVQLFELPQGGLLADTPGFNQPDLSIASRELISYFPEARTAIAANQCQFQDCLHQEEPGCTIRGDWERYEHYLKFLEESQQQELHRQQMPDEESQVKLKMTRSGQASYEPKLATKKYRRHSRRLNHQNLHEFYDHQTLRELSEQDGKDLS